MGEDNVQTVTVTRIRIPFGDILGLYLQSLGAALIMSVIVGLPALFLFAVFTA